MRVYFINQPNTLANNANVKNIEQNVMNIISECNGLSPRKTYLYSAEEENAVATTQAVAKTLKTFGKKIKQKNISIDGNLNSRKFGNADNSSEITLNEAELKKPINIIRHPKQVLSYALAELGFDNALKIETKKAFADRVFAKLYQMLVNHNGKDDVLIISASSDVYEIMQKDEGIHSMCYFGYEEAPNVSIKRPQTDKIGAGEKKFIEMGMPEYDKESNKYVPYWEKRAYEKHLNAMINEIEMQL